MEEAAVSDDDYDKTKEKNEEHKDEAPVDDALEEDNVDNEPVPKKISQVGMLGEQPARGPSEREDITQQCGDQSSIGQRQLHYGTEEVDLRQTTQLCSTVSISHRLQLQITVKIETNIN
jgi:hypothetical protein